MLDSFQLHLNIMNARHKANLSQLDAAKRLGVVQSTYSQIESGANFTVATLIKVADALGVTATELLDKVYSDYEYKFIVIESTEEDDWMDFFDTLEAANEHAEMSFNHLSKGDRARDVFVVKSLARPVPDDFPGEGWMLPPYGLDDATAEEGYFSKRFEG